MLTAMFSSFFHAYDVISPSKASTRNIKKLEERKMDPLSLEGYGGPTPPQRAPEKGKGGCWAEPTAPGQLWVPTAGGSYAHPVAPGRSVASVRPGGDPGVTAQHPLHHPRSPQMTRSLALPQKALPFLKSASPCRALLPSKPRKGRA